MAAIVVPLCRSDSHTRTIYILLPLPRPLVFALAGLMEGSIWKGVTSGLVSERRTSRRISLEVDNISLLFSLPLLVHKSSFFFCSVESARIRVVFSTLNADNDSY